MENELSDPFFSQEGKAISHFKQGCFKQSLQCLVRGNNEEFSHRVRGWEGSSQTTGAAVKVSTWRPQSWAAGKNYHQQTWPDPALSWPQGISADAFSAHLSQTSLFEVGMALNIGKVGVTHGCGAYTVVLLFLACAACAFQCTGYVLIHWSLKFGTYICICTYEESLSDFQCSFAFLLAIHVKLSCKWGSGWRRMVLLCETQAAVLWSPVHVCCLHSKPVLEQWICSL